MNYKKNLVFGKIFINQFNTCSRVKRKNQVMYMQGVLAGTSDKRCGEIKFTLKFRTYSYLLLYKVLFRKYVQYQFLSELLTKNVKIKTFPSNIFTHYIQESKKVCLQFNL